MFLRSGPGSNSRSVRTWNDQPCAKANCRATESLRWTSGRTSFAEGFTSTSALAPLEMPTRKSGTM